MHNSEKPQSLRGIPEIRWVHRDEPKRTKLQTELTPELTPLYTAKWHNATKQQRFLGEQRRKSLGPAEAALLRGLDGPPFQVALGFARSPQVTASLQDRAYWEVQFLAALRRQIKPIQRAARELRQRVREIERTLTEAKRARSGAGRDKNEAEHDKKGHDGKEIEKIVQRLGGFSLGEFDLAPRYAMAALRLLQAADEFLALPFPKRKDCLEDQFGELFRCFPPARFALTQQAIIVGLLMRYAQLSKAEAISRIADYLEAIQGGDRDPSTVRREINRFESRLKKLLRIGLQDMAQTGGYKL